MPFELVPFTPQILTEAAILLAQRHTIARRALPLLPARFEQPNEAFVAIKAALERSHASGVAAMTGGRLIGYLIGDMVFDHTWGRAAWVRVAGQALAPEQSVEVIRDLYAALSQRWVAYGCYTHVALVPTADQVLLDAWFRLSFGVEQMHALVDLERVETVPANPQLTIRKVTAQDGPILASFADIIWQEQVAAPTWAFTAPERADELPTLYANEVDDAEGVSWIAFEGDQPLGFQSYYPYPEGVDTLFTPPNCAELATAATLQDARGRGVGTALTQQGFAWAKLAGYRVVETDWRSANLLSSRFWPKMGFRPVVYRLTRRIDPRIAFAAGQRQATL
jgi:GNAT superfamily N-acetyltransferase